MFVFQFGYLVKTKAYLRPDWRIDLIEVASINGRNVKNYTKLLQFYIQFTGVNDF